jgi:uncharacterized membrane protein YoaK (UPF0700 family)
MATARSIIFTGLIESACMLPAPLRPTLPLVLSFNGGFVDTAGFLALQGLFTAHVTGNFVTLGASLVLGTSGVVAKLLALPVFCAVVIAARWFGTLLSHHSAHPFVPLLVIKVLLLIAGAGLAIHFGPFHDGDTWQAIITGMVLVAAMAIQNAVHRVHLSSSPPSTLMTGTTTQIMLDVADRIYPREGAEAPPARLIQMSINVVVFAAGCGMAALLYARFGVWCFVVPPAVAVLSLVVRLTESSKAGS